MKQSITGIILLIVCSTISYLAWRKFRRGRFIIAVALLMLCGFLLRLYISSDFFLHAWDERYHALVAKNLIKHPLLPTLYDDPDLPYNYRDWAGGRVWLHKQPLPLWSMALSMFLFGVNEIALRFPSILLTTIGIGLTWQIGYLLFGRTTGFIAAFLFAIHGLILEATGGRVATDHIDIFFLFWIELAVFFSIKFAFEKKQWFNIFCGLSIGAAILSKWLPALVVLPIWLLLVYGSRKYTLKEIGWHFGILCATIIFVVLPWQWYIYHTYPIEARWEGEFNWRHITEVLEGHSGQFYYHFDNMRIIYGELIYIPVAWFLVKTLKSVRNFKRWVLTIWVFLPFLFFSFVKTKMPGYTLFTAPALFIITAVFWQYLYSYRHKFKYTIPVYLTLFLLIALPIRYAVERLKPFQGTAERPRWIAELKQLERASENRKIVLFNVDYPVEAMFYADLTAYSTLPDADLVNRLLEKDYTILVNDKGDLGEKLDDVIGVQIIHLNNNQNKIQ